MINHIYLRHMTLAITLALAALHMQQTCARGLTSAGAATPFPVRNSTLPANVSSLFGEPVVNVLFILVQTCNSQPAATRQALEQYLFSDAPARANLTLQDLFTQCSYRHATFSRAISAVIGPVKIPCSSGGAKEAFATNRCAAKDIAGWANFADAHVKKLLQQRQEEQQGQQRQQPMQGQQVLLPKYKHHVYVMPATTPCGFIGYGDVGCAGDGPCRSWIHGTFWNQVPNYFHELGHNLGLNHAHAGATQYGDLSCSMGLCCNHRCFNAPHNWQLGWSAPMAQLNATNFPAARWLPFKLPAQASTKDNFVLVKAGSWGSGTVGPQGTTTATTIAPPTGNVTTVAEAASRQQRRLSAAAIVPLTGATTMPAASANAATAAPASTPVVIPTPANKAVAIPPTQPPAAATAVAAKAAAARNLFLSYRGAVGLDGQLAPGFVNEVLVHLYNSDDRHDLKAFTGLQSKLSAYNTVWHDAASHLVVWRGVSDARWCQVVLCRYVVDKGAECPLQQVQADHPRTS